jgi:hypothetical protein
MQTFKRKWNHREQVKREQKIQENKHEVRKKIWSALFIVVAADGG